jgi:hypothetical protein
VRDLKKLLAQVNPNRLIGNRNQQDNARSAGANRAAEPKHHEPLVLSDYPNRHEGEDGDQRDNQEGDDTRYKHAASSLLAA